MIVFRKVCAAVIESVQGDDAVELFIQASKFLAPPRHSDSVPVGRWYAGLARVPGLLSEILRGVACSFVRGKMELSL